MIIRYLSSLASSFFLIIFIGQVLHAQSVLSGLKLPEPDSAQYHEVLFRPFSILDTLAADGLMLVGKDTVTHTGIVFHLTVAGAVIAFADSHSLRPQGVEKRNAFPFRPWLTGRLYKLQFWKTVWPHGYARCRWLDGTTGQVLDEVFVCVANCKAIFTRPGIKIQGNLKIIMP